MIAALVSIWSVAEPFLYILGALKLLRTGREKVSRDIFEYEILPRAYDEFVNYISTYDLKEKDFAPGGKETYLKHLLKEISFNGTQYSFLDGEIEKKLIKAFNVPRENRFDKFLFISFLQIQFKNLHKFELKIEELYRFISKKRTYKHYISIDGWRARPAKELIQLVLEIKKIDPKKFEYYKFKMDDLVSYTNQNDTSSLKKVLNDVLAKGRISTKAVTNLISTEKILMLYKYAEDFSTVYDKQKERSKELSSRIAHLKKLTSTQSKKELVEKEEELNILLNNWLRTPVGTTLHKLGFKQLFPKDNFIFFLPLSQIPEKYHTDINSYVDQIIIKQAKEYIQENINSPFMEDFDGDIKYLLLANVVRVGDLFLYEKERELRISAPNLHQLMLSKYIDTQSDSISRIYVNDIVSNVDVRDQIDPNTKVGGYILDNFEKLKTELWTTYNIDIYRPMLLSALTENNIADIANKLLETTPGTTKYYLEKKLNELVSFYSQLKNDLTAVSELSKKK